MAAVYGREYMLWRDPITYLVWMFIVSLKFLLMRSYHSTDFEVHRNWMAITYNLPLREWYHSNVSQWTLDYPPLFAYFEWVLAQLAAFIYPAMLILQAQPFFTTKTLVFQRISEICADVVFFIACALFADVFVNNGWAKGTHFRQRLKLALYTFLVSNPALILLDNVHFQYNAFLYGLFLLSLCSIFAARPLLGALFFAVLVNFKHIYLYYAPAYVAYYLCAYLLPIDKRIAVRVASLAAVLAATLAFSFGPFLAQDGVAALQQIMGRLFPFKRGLTHAYWAPNFWALYNLVDYALYAAVSKIAIGGKCPNLLNAMLCKCPPSVPEYTRGLVQEYTHSVLPNVTPQISLALILCALVPCSWLFEKKRNRSRPAADDSLLVSLTLSAFAFVWFGWHVHEKAILMPFFPLCLLAVKNPAYLECFSLLCVASLFAQFPLFFTPLEALLKWTFALAHFQLCAFLANWVWGIRPAEVVRSAIVRLSMATAVAAQCYASFGHGLVFGPGRLEFLPMMLISITCAWLVLLAYSSFLAATFGESVILSLQKTLCRRKERKILHSERQSGSGSPLLFDSNSVRHIAGLDVSQCGSQPHLAVVSLTVLKYPEMEAVYAADEVVLLTSATGTATPYVSEYLALREADPLRRVILRHRKHCPKIDLLLVDGNGKWHSRGCGLGCHVGFDTGLPTIGVAKKFNGYHLVKSDVRSELDRVQERINRHCKSISETSIFRMLDDMNANLDVALLRTRQSVSPLFISPGWGIDFDTATEWALNCLGIHPQASPIRLSDLRSRALVAELFEK